MMDLTPYFDTLGLGAPLRTRALEVVQFYESVCPEDIQDIVITDYLQQDGTRVYEGLWLFSEHLAMEAKHFPSTDDFDIAKLKDVLYVRIEKQNYDFRTATEQSRLMVEFFGPHPFGGRLSTSGKNCDFLRSVYVEHFLKLMR